MYEKLCNCKGMHRDMTCTISDGKRFQYASGEKYKTDVADVGRRGFHGSKMPIDVIVHYPPMDSVYQRVVWSG